MILSVEHSELVAIADSLKEKLRYIMKDSYMEHCIKMALANVSVAITYMKNYEAQINIVENRGIPTHNIVGNK